MAEAAVETPAVAPAMVVQEVVLRVVFVMLMVIALPFPAQQILAAVLVEVVPEKVLRIQQEVPVVQA